MYFSTGVFFSIPALYMIEYEDAMQHNVDNSEMTVNDIVATFPEGRTVVKRLLKENQEIIDDYMTTRNEVREFLASRVSMFDIDICTEIVMACYQGKEKAEENIARLKRLMFAYEPPKQTGDSVSDAMIAKAKEYPIKHLVTIKNKHTNCLWHSDRHPSMYIYPDNHGYCFACHKYADAIDIYMQLNNADFLTAVRLMNKL